MLIDKKTPAPRRILHLCSLMGGMDLVTREVSIVGRPERVSVEAALWDELEGIAADTQQSLDDLCASLRYSFGPMTELDSAIRVFVLNHHRERQAAM